MENVSLENKGIVSSKYLSPQDSMKFLLRQVRCGEGTAYLNLADEYDALDSLGARNILEYYKEGGDILLTDDDIRRLEIIFRTETCSKTVTQ